MQTLHLRFRDLRAISSGETPSRWPSPSLRSASTWKGAPPLPNHPSPTSAVGLPPARSRQRLARCPTVGAGLSLASPLRLAWIVGPAGADPRRVCPRQTASDLSPYPAPHEAGDLGADHWRFAGGKPGSCRHRQVRRHEPPTRETPAADRPPLWGIGRAAGATVRDAIQPPRLVWEGLEGAARPSISMHNASRGSAIGWGFAPKRSHAKLGAAGGEFA